MPGDTRYSEGHSQCRESLICMINKKLSRSVFIGIMFAALGFPGIFILFAMDVETKQHEKITDIEKQIQVYSVKQDSMLFNQREFKKDMDKIQENHAQEMKTLHDKMDTDKKDLIKEMRRLHR